MIQNPITFVVSNNGTFLGGQRGTIRALSNYASKVYFVAPFESVSVKANYLIYESKREVIGQYLAPTTLKGSDVLATTDPQYQTAATWTVWEASISQRALHRIAKYRSGRIGISFQITSITQPSQALTSKGLFGQTQNDTLPSSNNVLGDFYVCDTYNFISNGITFTKGDYAYWDGSQWVKGQNIALVANTATQDLSVDPSLQAEIPVDISEDEELTNLIDTLISDVGDLSTDLTAHIADLDDPHDTQANQVDGTYRSLDSNVQASLNTIANELDGITDGETDITYDPSTDDIITATTVDGALGQLDFATHTHITDLSNPHQVNASQVNVSHQGSTVSVQTAITDLQNDKVEKDAPTITSITGSNKVYVNDGSDKLITVNNLRTYIVDELVSFAYAKFTEKDENGQPVIANPQTNKIYIYDDPNSEIANDIYEEWIYVQEDDTYEQIGTTQVQLSDYYTKTEADNLLDLKSDVGHTHDDRYYTETETDALIQVAKQIHYYPNTKNDSGLLIPKGTVVQFAGSQGDFIKIKSAVPAEIATSPEAIMGLAENDIADDAFGNVVWFGQVSEVVINPNNFNNGDILYFDYNTGGLTKTAPSENKIIIAAVEKVSSSTNATNGIYLVRPKWVSRNIAEIDGLQTQLDGYDAHIASTANPHSVTASQVGAYTTTQADTNFEPKNANIQAHISATNNPHGVTAAQVGAYTTGETDTAISTAISNLVDTAPDALNTLNELAAALGDDANFATTVTNALADKSDVGHTHDDRYYTETELDAGQLDNRYYTETEIDAILLTDSNTTHTQTESIKSVPVGTIDGQVSGFEAEGLTLENSVVNGDFSDGLNNWIQSGNFSLVSGKLVYDNIQDVAWFQHNTLNIINGNKYFLAFDISNNQARIQISVQDLNYSGQIIFPIGTNSYTLNPTTSGYLRIYAYIGSASFHIDNIMLINMTALGIESYTEAQMLDLVRSGYFDGLKSVEQPSITSVGKNLFDHRQDLFTAQAQRTIEQDGLLVTGVSTFQAIQYRLEVKPSTTYAFSTFTELVSGSFNPLIAFERLDDSKIRSDINGVGQLSTTFTTGSNDTEVYIRFYGTVTDSSGSKRFSNIQLELGSTATTYEPYKSSTLALDTPLRSLPNGVRDRVYEQNGEVWLEKRIEEYVLQSGDINALTTAFSNDIVRFIKRTDSSIYNNATRSLINSNTHYVSGYVNVADYIDTSNGLYTLFNFNATDIALVFPKGTYANLSAAQADLAGTVIQYQLATPQLINLTQQGKADGQLTAYANGTVYNTSDTFHADIHFDVASNRSAQISALIDNSDYQAKLIDSKASKVQEAWIEPTLLNGWVNYGITGGALASYMKDDMGFVHLKGLIKSGTTTGGTVILNLPIGYRPSLSLYFSVADSDGFARLAASPNGNISIEGDVANTYLSLDQIYFRAEQ